MTYKHKYHFSIETKILINIKNNKKILNNLKQILNFPLNSISPLKYPNFPNKESIFLQNPPMNPTPIETFPHTKETSKKTNGQFSAR